MKRLVSEYIESHEPLKQRICYLVVISGSDVMIEAGQRDVSWGLDRLLLPLRRRKRVINQNFMCPLETGGSDRKEFACNVGDPGSIPGLERSPGEGNDNPLQYSCLENFMLRNLAGCSPWGCKKLDMTNRLTHRSWKSQGKREFLTTSRKECSPANILILAHWGSCQTELSDNEFMLFQPLGLWYFVIAAVGNEYEANSGNLKSPFYYLHHHLVLNQNPKYLQCWWGQVCPPSTVRSLPWKIGIKSVNTKSNTNREQENWGKKIIWMRTFVNFSLDLLK